MQFIQEYHLTHNEANLACYTYYNPSSFIYLLCIENYYDVMNVKFM